MYIPNIRKAALIHTHTRMFLSIILSLSFTKYNADKLASHNDCGITQCLVHFAELSVIYQSVGQSLSRG